MYFELVELWNFLTIKLEKEKINLSLGKHEIASLLVKDQITKREVS